MFRLLLIGAAAAHVSAPLHAAEIVIPVAEGVTVEANEVLYDCGDRKLTVTYINAGSVSLAVTEIDGETLVASNVVSGSGARYAGGKYVWWSKGDEAQLYDLMQDEDTPVASCNGRD